MSNTPDLYMQESYMIDTHCHLDSTSFENDLPQVINNANNNNVKTIIIPAADMRDLPKAKQIAHSYENIFFASGAHPCELEHFDMNGIYEYTKDNKCVAIGECGLDYFRIDERVQDTESKNEQIQAIKELQKKCFIKQIELSIELDVPLIIHIREASNDSFEILNSYKKAYGVLHCYNADRILLNLSDRFYYGIGGVATFKNARRLIEALPLIPRDKILLETDSPYLTPTPHRGTRNEPSYIPLIAKSIAQTLNMDTKELIKLSTANAKKLFKKI